MSQVALRAYDLTIAYDRITVVHGVSFAAEPGRVTCIIGPNGAGKTTIIRTIAGLHRPRAGRVFFGDHCLNDQPAHARAALGIGLVPEGRRVFPSLSVLDNLRMGATTRSVNWSRPDGLERVFELFPELVEHSNRPAGLLSGGQQQMLAIGRALMTDPKLLILDEPFMGLAPRLIERIYSSLVEMKKQGVSILLSEQNARIALAISDYAYVLESGRIMDEGAASDMARSPRVQEIYLGA